MVRWTAAVRYTLPAVLLLTGCIKPEPALPPEEALAAANREINAILKEARAYAPRERPVVINETPGDPGRVDFWYYAHPLYSAAALGSERGAPQVLRPLFIGEWPLAVQKLTVALAAGDEPDMALVKRGMLAHLVDSGRIAQLDELLPPEFISDLRKPARQAFSHDGHLYALPADGFCSVLFYNQTLMDKPPATWTELRAIEEDFGKPDPAGPYLIGDLPFLESLWSAGGSVCDEYSGNLDQVPAYETLQFLLGLRSRGALLFSAMGRPERGFELFVSGRAAMTVASSSFLPRTRKAGFSVGMAPVPGMKGPVAVMGDDAIVVFQRYSRAKKKSIAQVCEFLTGSEVQGQAAADLGSVPVHSSVAEGVSTPMGLNQAFEHGHGAPLVSAWPSVESVMYRCLDRAYAYEPEAAE